MTSHRNLVANTESSSDHSLLRGCGEGNALAAERLYRRYAARVRALARAKFDSVLANRVDAEDVVQSVFRAVFDKAKNELYDVPEGGDLWGLLAVITINKIRSLREHHLAAKRDARNTVALTQELPSPNRMGEPIDADQAALVIRDLLSPLSDLERQIVDLRMSGCDVAEIAAEIGRSKRTIERYLQGIRNYFSQNLNAGEM